MSHPLENYGLIGDMQTAALVCRDGTVDWLCLPRFDSPAVFAGLLGTEDNGFWRMGPAHGPDGAPVPADRRRYRGETLILESEWDTVHGTVRIIDFMPPREDATPQLIRIVEGVSGRVPMRSALRMRFSYGWVVPWVHKVDERTVAVAGPDAVWLDTEAETYGKDLTTYADFTVSPGERIAFTLSWHPSHHQPSRTRRPAASSPRPPPRCPRTSAARATGTTVSPGCGMRRSPCPRCCAPATGKRPAPGSDGSSEPSPAIPNTYRSCTASSAIATFPSANCPGWPGMRTRSRCGSATAPPDSSSWTCTARSPKPCIWHARAD